MNTVITVVLGMCASGTSALAESLCAAGLDLGPVSETFENRRISLLHVSMTYWKDPRIVAPTEAHRRRRDEILESFDGQGFKEPLTLFTLDLWREVLDVRLVGTFRHPGIVMDRFIARYGGTREKWGRLWLRYNERLLELHEACPFPLVCFDRPEEEYRERVRKIAVALGLDPKEAFRPEARHETVGAAGTYATEAYRRLKEREMS